MPGDNASVLAAAADRVRCELTDGWHVIRTRGPNQVPFWLIALAVGIASGFAALFFRKGIEALQELLYRADDITPLHSWAGSLPWYWVLCIPILGGLLVGLILHVFTPDGRVRSVADVIQGAALNAGRVEGRAGLASAAASLITLGTGGSSGREGPVVHLAAVISSKVLKWIKAGGMTGRGFTVIRNGSAESSVIVFAPAV